MPGMAKKKSKKKSKSPKAKGKEQDNPKSAENESLKKKQKIIGFMLDERILLENSDEARNLYNQSRYGDFIEDGRIQLSLIEGLYLMQKGKVTIKDGRGQVYRTQRFIKRAKKLEPNFWIRYCVYKDMRNRGYIIKTALKFGADFRVYDRGIKPGEDHAKWIVYPVHEGSGLTWYEFAAKNRVAHSTKKRLLIGIVDDETSVTYYEIAWKRP